MSTIVIASHVHQSKWGWHPCDKEVFLKLKELNKIFVDALHKKAAWERWERKEPRNRVGRQKLRDSNGKAVGYGIPVPLNEPELNGLLEKQMYFSDVDRSGKYNIVKGKVVPVEKGKVSFIHQAELIAQEYKYARTPQPSDKGVRQLKLSVETIDRLLIAK